jgi:hypothetical protein
MRELRASAAGVAAVDLSLDGRCRACLDGGRSGDGAVMPYTVGKANAEQFGKLNEEMLEDKFDN